MRNLFLSMLAICSLTLSIGAADTPKKADRESLEQAFADRLTGSKLVGSFSFDGKDSGPNKPDKYQIVSAKKDRDDDWTITSRTKLGDKEVDLPIPIKVYWADDTPIMSLTDLTIPGMGTFTARVMFYGDRYAGTWQHGDVGGHMWGKVEKPPSK